MGAQTTLVALISNLCPMTMKEWSLGLNPLLVALFALQIIGVFSAFDCRRYVFAPICRGVTSKRSTIPADAESTSLPESFYQNEVLNSILEQIKHKYEEEVKGQEHNPDYSWVVSEEYRHLCFIKIP